jgi:hypothetical protein
MRGRGAAGAAAAVAAGFVVLALCAGTAAGVEPRLQYSISNRSATRFGSAKPVAPIAPSFVGASMDYCSITDYTGARTDPVLAALLLALAPQRPVIRIGGNGPDTLCPVGPRPITVAPDAIAALARSTNARLILGIDLEAHSGTRAAAEVQALVHAIDPNRRHGYIQAFEIGNEPDLYPQYGPFVAPAQVQPYFESYLQDFIAWAQLIRTVAQDPGVGIAGPSLGRLGVPWITGSNAGNFGAFLTGPARAAPITFHTYPLLGTDRCPDSTCPTVPNLLRDRFSHGLAEQLVPFARPLGPGQTLRVDEMNSVSGGGAADVSNTFASALWALDTLFEYASAGAGGVNFHTFPAAQYALYSGPGQGGWRVYPEYYGLLAFEYVAPAGAQLLSIVPDGQARSLTAVKLWAAREPDGKVRIVAINKDIVSHLVLLHGGGVPLRKTATIGGLEAPPSLPTALCPTPDAAAGLCATGGVTLDGASFGPAAAAGGDRTRTGLLAPPRHAPCSRLLRCTKQSRRGTAIELTLPPGTATFVSGTPSR